MDNLAFQDIIQYAPWLLVAFLFFKQNRMFVTPELLQETIQDLKEKIDAKFVRKDVHNIAITELKADISDMKEKIDQIYNKVLGID
jgi:hypothetical protein